MLHMVRCRSHAARQVVARHLSGSSMWTGACSLTGGQRLLSTNVRYILVTSAIRGPIPIEGSECMVGCLFAGVSRVHDRQGWAQHCSR